MALCIAQYSKRTLDLSGYWCRLIPVKPAAQSSHSSAGGAPIFDANGEASGISADNELYAVPANVSRTVINGNQPSQAIVIRAQNPSNGQMNTVFRTDLNDIPYFDWVPE